MPSALMFSPAKRSKIPPLGFIRSPISTKCTSELGTPAACSARISSEAMTALCE
ncbi:Uncharacterised protein [Mycobacterium tuberculosis]|nr:Uncharacterised protein [Mycobacterium tuberculosis]